MFLWKIFVFVSIKLGEKFDHENYVLIIKMLSKYLYLKSQKNTRSNALSFFYLTLQCVQKKIGGKVEHNAKRILL